MPKLLPGRSKLGRGENGVSYIDDFENARTPYSLGGLNCRYGLAPGGYAAAPTGGNSEWPAVGYQRAKLAWYTVDQTYYTDGPEQAGQHSRQAILA